MIILATAHPSKFPHSVKASSGIYPQLPERSKDLMLKEEDYTLLSDRLEVIEDYILRYF